MIEVSATAPIPTLSQIVAWDTEHLDTAATQWQSTADTWDAAFSSIYRQAPNPGGVPWTGATADAAVLRAGQDRAKVLGAVDCLYGAARAAAVGAEEIQGAKRLVLGAVEEARAAGFSVGESLTVTSQAGGSPALRAARHLIFCYPSARSDFGGAKDMVTDHMRLTRRLTCLGWHR